MEEDNRENPPEISEKLEDLTGVKDRTPGRVFWYLRYAGWFFIAISTIFLFQKSRPPLIVIGNSPIANGPLGNLLLLIGIILFGIYLAQRIYLYFKS